jgi:hypothetical protein
LSEQQKLPKCTGGRASCAVNSRKRSANCGGRSVIPSTAIGRSCITCAALGRNGMPSARRLKYVLSMRMERNASSRLDPARERNRLLGHLWNSSLPRQGAARLGPFRPKTPDAGDRRFRAPLQGTGLRIAGNLLPPPFPVLPPGSTKMW